VNHAWVVNLSRHVEPRRIGAGQTFALMALGLLACFGLGLALSSCKAKPVPSTDPERFDRSYIAFVDKEVSPLAKRDGMTHTSGGCDVTATDLLCVECYSPGGESWVRCDDDGCELAKRARDLEVIGADVGVCERWEARNGLAISFTRRAR